MSDWFKRLNEQQIKAVQHINGPLFVIAGAGTGKTRTLTTRVAYLIKEIGIAPESILAVTFTNKAAREMKDRIIDMAGPYASSVWIYTFHAFSVQVLRRDIETLGRGYTKEFNIADEDDAKSFVRDAIKMLNLDIKQYRVNDMRYKISEYKHLGNDLFDNDYNQKNIFLTYQKLLLENNLLDFDDLQRLTFELFSEHKDILSYYQDKFNYVLVDEFQDTDHIQYQMIKLLSEKHRNIFVVGDPDQSIYAFRGANYDNANQFKRDFGHEHVLDINYRSTVEILNYANKLIKYNQNRPFKKELQSKMGNGTEPVISVAHTDYNEAQMVANEIERLVNDFGYQYEDIAILYRNNSLSRIFEDTFMKYNIPYVIYGGLSFYQRKEIKDILAYVRMLVNPHLDFYLKRVINVPKRAIGNTTLAKLDQKARELGLSMYNAIDYLEVSGKTKDSLIEFKGLMETMKDRLSTMEHLSEVVNYVAYQTGYFQMLEEEHDDLAQERIDNIKELASVFVQGEEFYEGSFIQKLSQLLDQIALYTDLDKVEAKNSVKLATIHQVKGLEFRAVFMVAMEEEIFPAHQSSLDPRDMEEERRVAYVGVTRAKERLYLTRAEQRLVYGTYMRLHPSRFLREMQPQKEILTRQTEMSKNAHFLKPGDKVVHQVFGPGIVVNLEDDIATIAFKLPHGIKKILENHPALKKVDN